MRRGGTEALKRSAENRQNDLLVRYDDFERERLPQLQHRLKVKLKTRWVQAFDHREGGQL